MRSVMFALAIMTMATTTASAQSSGPANAFFGGLGSPGIWGSSYQQQPLPPQSARQKAATKRALEMVRRGQLAKARYSSSGYIGQCNSLCQAKCQATWQRGGLPNVEACYAKWSRLSANGTARQCEAANRARLAGQPKLPGC